MTVTIEQAENDLRGIIERAAAGETITIEENGKAVARIIMEATPESRFLAAAKAAGWQLPTQPKRPSSEIAKVRSVGGKPASEMVIEDRR